MTPQVISVTEFMTIINETLSFAYPQVVVEGEVSGFKISQGKFAFFDLKDDKSLLGCFMMAHDLKLPIEDGMKIRVTGAPKVFPKSSRFSLTVRSIELAGEGELRRAMELLKRKLHAEGLFDSGRRRPIPKFPTRIGLITSGTSAAYADFIKILGARWSGVEVLLADVSVQGLQAPDQIVGALEYFNQLSPPVDMVVLIRGGGSLEDLMAFSTEPVARAVAASRTPIVVGVGHEVDVSLADYAADLRAATPTDAARLVVPDRQEILSLIAHHTSRQEGGLTAAAAEFRRRTDQALSRLETSLRHPRERVTALQARLERGLDRILAQSRAHAQYAQSLEHRLSDRTANLLIERRSRVIGLTRLLRGFDSQAVLARGYSITRAGGRVLRRAAEAKPGGGLMIQLAEGIIAAKVEPSHDK
ncbi:MAG: exodeoxyribonuclease VII large subunit [Candidatus Saccharimonadales bacterium]